MGRKIQLLRILDEFNRFNVGFYLADQRSKSHFTARKDNIHNNTPFWHFDLRLLNSFSLSNWVK